MIGAIISAAMAITMSHPPALGLIPRPTHCIEQEGSFLLNVGTAIYAEPGLAASATKLRELISPATGFALATTKEATKGQIQLRLDKELSKLGEEGYRLSVTPDGITVTGFKEKGLYYGFQTLRQLMRPEAYAAKPQKLNWPIPAVWIEDVPRFAWRGAMLDCARHFMPKEFIKRYLDLMAMHKLNSFHWHLTDDQGWRIEIKRYPKLTSIGSRRKSTMDGHYNDNKQDGVEHGGFYTQEDIKEIIAYAAARNINIVPEIEMPGHSQAAIAAYPELGNSGKQIEVATTWGVIENVLNVEDSTVQFMKNVLDEVIALFPSKFIHVGGDECPKKQWKESLAAQNKMRALGLKNENELQSWFMKQIDAHVESRGRRMIGWDEILEGGLAPGAAVMSWRGEAGGIEAAESGHDVVMASYNALYFDYYQAPKEKEPLAIGGLLPLRTVYEYEIVPAKLDAKHAKHILGGQYQVWTEYIKDGKKVEYMAFPRACAASELFWSPKEGKNYGNFVGRLKTHMARLSVMGVNARPLDPYTEDAPSAKWTPNDVSNDYQVKTWDVSSQFKSAGDFLVKFQYTSGSFRLDIDGIEILVNGSVVASDKHYGRTGSRNVDNVWRVSMPAVASGAKVELRAKVRADGGSDSYGEITISRV